MVTADEDAAGSQRGAWEDVLSLLEDRALWKLLVRAVEVFVPGGQVTLRQVRPVERSTMLGIPVFLSDESGFGLSPRARTARAEPQREIYIRGRDVRSIGIVITGSAAAAGTRVLDAARLLRYARRLTFESLFVASDEGSVVPALRAARAVDNVVLLDPAVGVGLCAEIDPLTRAAACPLFVRLGEGGAVHAYASGGWAAQAVRSQT